jgi:hypothetical protein
MVLGAKRCRHEEVYLRNGSFFHNLFFTDAALLFPNMNEEVCLSAPVLREVADEPAKTSLVGPII